MCFLRALQNFHSYEKNVRRRKVELQSIIRTQLAEDLKKKKARRRRELRERKQSKHVFQPPVFQQPEDQGFFITENFGGGMSFVFFFIIDHIFNQLSDSR